MSTDETDDTLEELLEGADEDIDDELFGDGVEADDELFEDADDVLDDSDASPDEDDPESTVPLDVSEDGDDEIGGEPPVDLAAIEGGRRPGRAGSRGGRGRDRHHPRG